MQHKFIIGGHPFKLASCSLSPGSNGNVDVQICSEPHGLTDGEIFDSYYSHIDIQISSIRRTYHREGLRLSVQVQPGQGLSIYLYGLRYGDFTGTLEVGEGVLTLKGLAYPRLLSPKIGPTLKVDIVCPCSQEEVGWESHHFQSLQEACLAPAEVVNYLEICPAECHRFPPEVERFANLKELRLGNILEEIGLEEIPAAIGGLRELRGLFVFGAKKLTTLPVELLGLSQLESLYCHGCGLKSLPEQLFDLPNLTSVAFSNNALETIPDSIGRASRLERLELAGNRLTTLPGSLGELPLLQVLSLRRNPLESLPPTLSRLKDVCIEIEKIKLYRNISYPSKNPKPIQDGLYALDSQADQLEGLINQWPDLRDHCGAIMHFARLCLYLQTTIPDDPPHIGGTRLGGLPDLPNHFAYPTNSEGQFFTFLAQLNLEELAPLQNYLPRRGWLYFFVQEEEQFENPRVLYFDGPREALSTFQLHGTFADSDRDAAYPAYRVQVEQGWSLPYIYASESYGHARFGEWLPHFAALEEQAYAKTPDPYSTVATRDGHTINGFVFTQHESPEEQAAQQKLGEAREWMNLLSLGHDNKVGFCFWDAGNLTFSVHKKDLAIADFENVVATLESS